MPWLAREPAMYVRASLQHVNRECLTNSSLRKRFGIPLRKSAGASRLTAGVLDAGAIVTHNPTAACQQMRQMPWRTKPGEAGFT